MTEEKENKAGRFLASILDPGVWFHLLRMLHYWGYSHVLERRKIRIGQGTGIAPNVSFRNGERIEIGSQVQIGESCCIWAGSASGRIRIGNQVSLAPNVFITASDYRFEAGVPFRRQPRRESDVEIGDDVWIGTGVVITAGVQIGDGCIVGAGAVVTKSLPAGAIAVGVPARIVGQREHAPAVESTMGGSGA